MKIIFAVVVLSLSVIIISSACNATPNLEYVFSNDIMSDYVTKSGGKIGEGPVNQAMLALGINKWYVYGWHNYDLDLDRETEYDLGAGKWVEFKNFIIDLSYQNLFVEKIRVHMLEAVIKFKYPINTSFVWSKPFLGGFYADRNRFYLEMKKPFKIGVATFSPTISTAYLNNFYAEHGWAHVTGGIIFEYPLAKKVSMVSSIKYQEGLLSSKESLVYGGAGIKILF